MTQIVDKILKEGQTLTAKEIQLIAQYVNEHKTINNLLKIKIPDELKYSGTVFRMVNLSKKELNYFLANKKFKFNKERNIVSYAKNLRGITEFYYNSVNDFPSKFNYCLILKGKLTLNDCIIDITKFSRKYKNIIHSGYTAYTDENEVIGKNIFPIISFNNVDGIGINGEFNSLKQYKE